MKSKRIYLRNSTYWKNKSLEWLSKNFSYVFAFQGNGYSNGFDTHFFASNAISLVNELADFDKYPLDKNYCFALSYDLKNQIEKLESNHISSFDLPDIALLKAEIKLSFEGNHVIINTEKKSTEVIYDAITNSSLTETKENSPIFKSHTHKDLYLDNFVSIQEHITNGDIYEMCYCIAFSDKSYQLKNPASLYQKLCSLNPKPFSTFVKLKDYYLISASPERYLKVEGDTIISQPIKGTSIRGKDEQEDLNLKQNLRNSPKEQAENLMIVDLVRNDLSRISKVGSVKVDELFGIYSFPDVHQMISTVSGELKQNTSFSDIVQATFPMGSMTGAPKIKAMELIERYESFKRGWYSGTVGYFTANGFDSNVVIRSLQYDNKSHMLSYHVGSAITYESEGDNEYEECLAKGKSLNTLFED